MRDIQTTHCFSSLEIDSIAQWIRASSRSFGSTGLNLIKFLEFELPQIFPELEVHVQHDYLMSNSSAFFDTKNNSLVISESIYVSASNNDLRSCEIILHEVAHLFLHSKNYKGAVLHSSTSHYKKTIDNMELYHSTEWQANELAKCLLFPSNLIGSIRNKKDAEIKIGKMSEKQYLRLERHFEKIRLKKADRWQKETKVPFFAVNFPIELKAQLSEANGQIRLF